MVNDGEEKKLLRIWGDGKKVKKNTNSTLPSLNQSMSKILVIHNFKTLPTRTEFFFGKPGKQKLTPSNPSLDILTAWRMSWIF